MERQCNCNGVVGEHAAVPRLLAETTVKANTLVVIVVTERWKFGLESSLTRIWLLQNNAAPPFPAGLRETFDKIYVSVFRIDFKGKIAMWRVVIIYLSAYITVIIGVAD